ncbi:hypothetical protein [Schlesneria sp. DSM 10557]|uniref:hypothetical protein n=1 Tax=Schlesneria sp. DSM 10557 TaxID=3044399 RepID=UPI0035A1C4AC
MSNQLLNETLITIPTALKLIPGNPGPATGSRIIMRGARGQDGQLHRLETIKVCRRRWTSEEAVQRWLEAINSPPVPNAEPSPSTRQRRSVAAKLELQEMLG